MSDGALAARIARRIRAEGPLSLAAFMALALYDPEYGYYASRQPLGAAGDFVTAPEISQIFGESIGVWCALVWEELGRPDPVVLAELGPGSGRLAADLLRAAHALPDFRHAIQLYLIEASAVLRAEQQRRLRALDAAWLTRIEELPDGPLLLVANEFLDALPIRQLVRGSRHWSERMVALGPGARFVFADGPESPALSMLVPAGLRETAPAGAVFEICPPALALATALGARLGKTPGAALFIDYGRAASAPGASLRAVRRHVSVDPLGAPGAADLSADVDFAAFAAAAVAADSAAHGPLAQGCFLERLGARARLAALSARASPSQRSALEGGLARLIEPQQMGALFKVLALTAPGSPPPPGFER